VLGSNAYSLVTGTPSSEYEQAVSTSMSEPSRETLKLCQSVLDETWSSLRPEEQAGTSKTQIAACILELAASGERDPVRLRNEAMAKFVACPMP
jgi:hypothetical protein